MAAAGTAPGYGHGVALPGMLVPRHCLVVALLLACAPPTRQAVGVAGLPGGRRLQQCGAGNDGRTFVNNPVAANCKPCAAGKHDHDQNSANACKDCPAGRFSGAGQAACALCGRGRFASAPGASACQQCSAHRYSGDGATQCATLDLVPELGLNFLCRPPPTALPTGYAPACVSPQGGVPAPEPEPEPGSSTASNVSSSSASAPASNTSSPAAAAASSASGGACVTPSYKDAPLLCGGGGGGVAGVPYGSVNCSWRGAVCAPGYVGAVRYSCDLTAAVRLLQDRNSSSLSSCNGSSPCLGPSLGGGGTVATTTAASVGVGNNTWPSWGVQADVVLSGCVKNVTASTATHDIDFCDPKRMTEDPDGPGGRLTKDETFGNTGKCDSVDELGNRKKCPQCCMLECEDADEGSLGACKAGWTLPIVGAGQYALQPECYDANLQDRRANTTAAAIRFILLQSPHVAKTGHGRSGFACICPPSDPKKPPPGIPIGGIILAVLVFGLIGGQGIMSLARPHSDQHFPMLRLFWGRN